MKKVMTIVGARPQFVKAAIVSRAIRAKDGIKEILVHTGQHFDKNMSDIFFDEMDIPKPDFHLNIHSLNHGAMTGRMMEGIEQLILDHSPDMVLIYGDTNSTLAGALAAKKLHVPVAHIEAGLRSFNIEMPEEVNRILADRISNILYCPTSIAKQNLVKEGFEQFDSKIIITGDVMYDTAMYYAGKAAMNEDLAKKIGAKPYLLVTLHRAENTDDPNKLSSICRALNTINEQMNVILPLHPRTKKLMEKYRLHFNFQTIDPLGYLDMVSLLKETKLVITDSGGLQKEAYFFKKPCITMREQTEWTELIEAGVNVLVGSDEENIKRAFYDMRSKTLNFESKLYGDGNASENIAQDIYLSLFG